MQIIENGKSMTGLFEYVIKIIQISFSESISSYFTESYSQTSGLGINLEVGREKMKRTKAR